MSPDRGSRLLVVAARLLLAGEALGMWAALIQWAPAIVWLGIYAVIFLAFPLFVGTPALVVALRADLYQPRGRTVAFLALNAGIGLLFVSEAIGQSRAYGKSDPEPHLMMLGTAAILAGLLVLVATLSIGVTWKRGVCVVALLVLAYTTSYAAPLTSPVVAALHLEGVLTVPANTTDLISLADGQSVVNRLDRSSIRYDPYSQIWLVHPLSTPVQIGAYRVELICLDASHRSITVEIGLGQSVTVSDPCPPPVDISAASGKCGPFPEPLPPLPPSPGPGFALKIGPSIGVEGSGCGPGQVPTDGSSFVVDAGWTLAYAYTCNGLSNIGPNHDVIQFSAHRTTGGPDPPPVAFNQVALAGRAIFGDESPTGTYVIRVTLPFPHQNQCQWHIEVHRAG